MDKLRDGCKIFTWLTYLVILQCQLLVSVLGDQSIVEAVVGTTAQLPCMLDSHGDLRVIWKDPSSGILTVNQEQLDDKRFSVLRPYQLEWNLQIEHVRQTDQGIYTCQVSTTPPTITEVQLIVHSPPTISSSSQSMLTSKIGDTLALHCNATANPTPTISWYKLDEAGQQGAAIWTGWEFVIRNVSQQDGGSYLCQAANGISPSDKKTIDIDIRFAPEVLLPHQRVSQLLGKDTLLECVVSGSPITSLYWMRGGMPLQESVKYAMHTWQVTTYTRSLAVFIKDLQQTDFGDYTCVAENELGKEQKSVTLFETRKGDIRLIQQPKNVLVQKGDDALLACKVEGLSHRDNLIWWKHSALGNRQKIFVSHPTGNEQLLIDNQKNKYLIEGQYSLHVNKVTFEDSGLYSCEIIGFSTHSANITVIGQPECSSEETVFEGTEANIWCSVDYAGPTTDIRASWSHGDRRLSSIEDDKEGLVRRSLSFPAVPRDSGDYTCTMSSTALSWTGSCSTKLTVEAFSGTSQPVCSDDVDGMSINFTLILCIFGAAVGGLLILFLCILAAVICNFKAQLKQHRKHHHSGSKNGVLKMESDKLMGQTEVEV